jgi:hypothetical protein
LKKAESAQLRKFLDGEGNQKVTKIQIARKPVHSVIQKDLDVISLGKFSKTRKSLGYDDIFHQYLLVTLQDGSTHKLEMNHQIEATPAQEKDFKGDSANVSINKDITMKEMMDTAAKDNDGLFRYRSGSQNCQVFTKTVLNAKNLKPDAEPVIQDAGQLIDSLPLRSTLPNIITDSAAYLDNVVHGGSLNIGKWY